MTKKVLLAAVAACGLALAGCAGSSTTLQNDVAAVEANAQADANVLCGFVPTIATIAALIPGFGTAATSAATIAGSVCQAVAAAPVVKSASFAKAKLGVETNIGTIASPAGAVAVVGHFTR